MRRHSTWTILLIDLGINSVINDDVTHANHFRDFVIDDFLMCVHFRHSGAVHTLMTDIMIPFSRFSSGFDRHQNNIFKCHGNGAISCTVVDRVSHDDL